MDVAKRTLVMASQYTHLSIILLCTLNSYDVMCPLYLNITGGKSTSTGGWEVNLNHEGISSGA